MRVPSTEVQNNFGKYLKFAEANEEVIVTRNGKDIVRMVPCGTERIREGAAEYRTTSGRVTYEEFLELTEASEQRYELIDGVVYNLVSPSYKHQRVIAELLFTFVTWFKGKTCTALTSPFDITFDQDPDNICVVQPDIVVLCDPHNRDEKDRYRGVPTLVVEVLSPSTRGKDLSIKLELYRRCGVGEYWLVDPKKKQILVYQLADGDVADFTTYRSGDIVESVRFEGLRVPAADLFAPD